MKTIKGPAIFLAQFAGDAAPFNSLDASPNGRPGLGYKGMQIPSWDGRLFDLKKAARVQDLLRRDQGHRQGSTASRSPSSRPISRASSSRCNPAYDAGLRRLRAAGGARQSEGAAEMGGRAGEDGAPRPRAISASTRMVTFSGAFAWPFSIPGRSARRA